MRLIDADALIDDLCEGCFGRSCGCEGDYCLDIKHINKAPTAEDAVVVVRCKYCAHYEEWTDKFGAWKYCNLTDLLLHDGNGYCNHGERGNDNAID